ncbi:MarR family transcriptional regulator [Catellatospora sichuanensis]|uniref:MarR family transcriptional regulator n=1 Tax=Catellatospora sichuanensis TaxID=1969805 RepID=UPI0011828003|nr:MarR family transcriptional regulator [Catellatospora sichuanensis]
MSSVTPGDARARRRLTNEIKGDLRELRNQLAMLNRQVGARLELNDVDMDCLDLISRHGPLSPSAVARRAGLHPATMTGILDRLERAGWVARERDPADRRGVTVRALPDRAGEMYGLLAGMNSAMDDICAGYTDAELDVVAGFLSRAIEAGRGATEELAGS